MTNWHPKIYYSSEVTKPEIEVYFILSEMIFNTLQNKKRPLNSSLSFFISS